MGETMTSDQDSTRVGQPKAYTAAAFATVFAVVSTMVLLLAWPYETMRLSPIQLVPILWLGTLGFIGVAFDTYLREKQLRDDA